MTSSEVLDTLLEVDGSGSLLDSDLLDGFDSDDFAKRTSRVLVLPFVGGSGFIAASGYRYSFILPPDMDPTGPATLHFLTSRTAQSYPVAQCTGALRGYLGSGSAYRLGSASTSLASAATVNDETLAYEFALELAPSEEVFETGVWGEVSVGRDNALDTCESGDLYRILGVSLIYSAF